MWGLGAGVGREGAGGWEKLTCCVRATPADWGRGRAVRPREPPVGASPRWNRVKQSC